MKQIRMGTHYAHSALQPFLATLPAAQRFYLTSEQYATLEGEEPRFGPTTVAPAAHFALIIDDGQLDPTIDGTDSRSHTDVLLVEADGDRWIVAEQVRFTVRDKSTETIGTTVLGAAVDLRQQHVASLCDNPALRHVGDREYQRLVIVALAFAYRYQDGSLSLSPYADALPRARRRALERAGTPADGSLVTFASALAPPTPTLWRPRASLAAAPRSAAAEGAWWDAGRVALARAGGMLLPTRTP